MRNLVLILSFLLLAACAHENGSPGISPTGEPIASTPVDPTPPPAPLCGYVLSCGLYCLKTYPAGGLNAQYQQCMHWPANNVPGYVYTP